MQLVVIIPVGDVVDIDLQGDPLGQWITLHGVERHIARGGFDGRCVLAQAAGLIVDSAAKCEPERQKIFGP